MPNGELISVTINDGIKKFSELGRHDNSNEDKSKYKKVCIGDIAYNSMRMWQGASGYSPYNGIVSPAYTVLLANEGVNSKCIAYQFKLPGMIHAFQINSQGITSDNWNLKFQALSDITIYISRSIDEQGKIAVLLESIDRLITLHQSKYFGHILKVIVSCALYWEQCKLGEMCSLITKGTTPLDKSSVGTINFVKIESIDEASGEIKITQKITDEEHNSYLRRSQLKENDILFSIAGTLGRVTSVKLDILPANTNQALAIIRLKSGCLQYIKTYLKGKAVADFIKKNPTIGAQPNLSLEQVGNLEIALPTEKEQALVGAYFESLDNLITLHQSKLEKLQKIKKSMLESMFV